MTFFPHKTSKKQKDTIKISKIRNAKRDITRDSKEIQRIIMSYIYNLYTTKLKNLNEMDNEQVSGPILYFLFCFMFPIPASLWREVIHVVIDWGKNEVQSIPHTLSH